MAVAKKYRPDVPGWMAQCAVNYASLCKLLPEPLPEGAFMLALDGQAPVRISVEQQSRYTLTLKLEDTSPLHRWLGSKAMLVRLYHDAHMAEVLAGVNQGMLKAVRAYPNDDMSQVDEKERLNHFLGEWLAFCLRFGRSHIQGGNCSQYLLSF